MSSKLKKGDVLIIGGQSFMIVEYNGFIKINGAYDEFKYALMNIGSYDMDYLSKEMYNLEIGNVIFSQGLKKDEYDMKLEMIIPSEKVNFSFKL